MKNKTILLSMEKSTPLLNPSHFRFDTSQDFQIIESPLINSPLLPSLENNPKTPSLPIVLFANSLRSSWNDIAYNILRSVHSENSFEKKGEFGSILKKHSFLKKDLNPSPQNDKKINFNEGNKK